MVFLFGSSIFIACFGCLCVYLSLLETFVSYHETKGRLLNNLAVMFAMTLCSIFFETTGQLIESQKSSEYRSGYVKFNLVFHILGCALLVCSIQSVPFPKRLESLGFLILLVLETTVVTVLGLTETSNRYVKDIFVMYQTGLLCASFTWLYLSFIHSQVLQSRSGWKELDKRDRIKYYECLIIFMTMAIFSGILYWLVETEVKAKSVIKNTGFTIVIMIWNFMVSFTGTGFAALLHFCICVPFGLVPLIYMSDPASPFIEKSVRSQTVLCITLVLISSFVCALPYCFLPASGSVIYSITLFSFLKMGDQISKNTSWKRPYLNSFRHI